MIKNKIKKNLQLNTMILQQFKIPILINITNANINL